MRAFDSVEVVSRAELRAWLVDNYTRTESVWLITYKKHVPEKYVSWDEIVSELLCFGWIDSHTRRVDADRTKLLISPRRKGSPWSPRNKRHVARLEAEGLIEPPGWAAIERAKQDGSWTVYDEVEALIIPPDLADALAANRIAKRNFNGFPDSVKKGILWWIKTAKRAATRQKRIDETVWLAEHNVRANQPEAQVFKRQNQRE